MQRTNAPQSRWLRLQRWWKGNWSELPAWWKVRSRGEYVTGLSIPVALGLFYAIGQFAIHAARGQTDLGIRFLLVMPVVVVLAYGVGIPATLLVARMSYRRNHKNNQHDRSVGSDS